MVYCTKCGANNSADAKFCVKCGADLEQESAIDDFAKKVEKGAEEFARTVERETTECFGSERGMANECFGLRWGGTALGVLFGIFIIAIGVSIYFGEPIWRWIWPSFVIALGLLIIIGALSKRK